MAWKEVGAFPENGEGGKGDLPPIFKWTEVGETIIGVFKGFKGGNKTGFKPLILIGDKTYGGATVLEKKLREAKPGDMVKVIYLGKKRSAGGNHYHDFQVYIEEGQGERPMAPATRLEGQLFDSVEFARLINVIKAEKDEPTAQALSTMAKLSADPVKSLKVLMAQIGVDEVPF